MKILTEEEFTKGNDQEKGRALLISEDLDNFIDEILDKVYGMNLTPEEEKEIGIYINRTDYSLKEVKFIFAPGNDATFSRRERENGGKVSKTSHELTFHEQSRNDQILSFLSSFAIIGSRIAFSYNESREILNFNEGEEVEIKLRDGEDNLTQYSKLGFTKKAVFKPQYGLYSFEYLDRDSYIDKYDKESGHKYTDKNGQPLTQQELIATSFDSVVLALDSFEDKFSMFRNQFELYLEQIESMKSKNTLS